MGAPTRGVQEQPQLRLSVLAEHGTITSYEQGSSGGGCTVRAGDTLAGIAAQVWGDASLSYKLASANRLAADSALTAGQTLTLPAGVVRTTYNASQLRPYDPSDAIGDVSSGVL